MLLHVCATSRVGADYDYNHNQLQLITLFGVIIIIIIITSYFKLKIIIIIIIMGYNQLAYCFCDKLTIHLDSPDLFCIITWKNTYLMRQLPRKMIPFRFGVTIVIVIRFYRSWHAATCICRPLHQVVQLSNCFQSLERCLDPNIAD